MTSRGAARLTKPAPPEQQSTTQSTSSLYTSKHGDRLIFRDVSAFPLSLTTNYTLFESAHRFSADVHSYSYDRALSLPPSLGGVEGRARVTKSRQEGHAEITGKEGQRSTGWGMTREHYRWMGERGETYEESVRGTSRSDAPVRRPAPH